MSEQPQQDDHEQILDQVAEEMIAAIENKDKDQLLDCFQVLVSDIMSKLQGN